MDRRKFIFGGVAVGVFAAAASADDILRPVVRSVLSRIKSRRSLDEVLADEAFMAEHFIPFYRNTGPSMSPFNA